MGRKPHYLRNLRVASPCPALWSEMEGDDKTRFCRICSLNVHNLSAMTEDEAEALLAGAAGRRLCVRFYRRADGRVLTQDCPIGKKDKRRKQTTAALTATAAATAAAFAFNPAPAQGVVSGSVVPISSGDEAIVGKMAVPLPPEAVGAEPLVVMGKFPFEQGEFEPPAGDH